MKLISGLVSLVLIVFLLWGAAFETPKQIELAKRNIHSDMMAGAPSTMTQAKRQGFADCVLGRYERSSYIDKSDAFINTLFKVLEFKYDTKGTVAKNHYFPTKNQPFAEGFAKDVRLCVEAVS